MLSELSLGKQLTVLGKPHARSHQSYIPQSLLLRERWLTTEMHAIANERKEVRERIRQALNDGAKCSRGFRSAAVVTRHVLLVR